ncbi:hypothetical protein CZ787_07815 [Halomonas citrativorans]|uniref:Uncharacterized protein n=1 Tax=Halomonas citrativorans TaxID=2742612 RepID=A0A1R4HXL0_9GAMM|nr:hypothetical protein CZ787_07815 [Halomonas citrativorans]
MINPDLPPFGGRHKSRHFSFSAGVDANMTVLAACRYRILNGFGPLACCIIKR